MKKFKIMTIFGTRPEVIKLAPIIKKLEHSSNFESVLVATGQHRDMLEQAMAAFNIKPAFNLNIMKADQGVSDVTVNSLMGIEELIKHERPDLVIVQGDTTTAFSGCLAAFYQKVAVAHVEAGLRSYDKFRPFPEEINRSLITQLADLHFVPTATAWEALRNEGIPDERIFITGNTVIDSLFQVIDKDYQFADPVLRGLNGHDRKLIVVTSHRRENFGQPLLDVCQAVKSLVDKYSDIEVVFSVHRNPHVMQPVGERLGDCDRVHLVEPLDYADMANLLARCHLVLTDSGGIQEESPALAKPVLVLRDVTERPEAVQAGMARIVGTDVQNILAAASQLLDDEAAYRAMSVGISPYGDGRAASRVVAAIEFKNGMRTSRPAPFASMAADALMYAAAPANNEIFYLQLDERIRRAKLERQRVSVATFKMEAASSEQFSEAVRKITRSLRKSDTAAALEGRHLVLVLPGAGREQARLTANRLLEQLAQPQLGRRAEDGGLVIKPALADNITVEIETFEQSDQLVEN